MIDLDRIKSIKHLPAFIYDEVEITKACQRLNRLCNQVGVSQLFPLKCHSVYGSLNIIAKHVDGFAVSSLFEAQLARDILDTAQEVHFTSPSLQDKEIEALLSLCDSISFNSLSQWNHFGKRTSGKVKCSLRVNPQLSFIEDDRYNPCRPNSRLGIPIEQLKNLFESNPELFENIEGLHFHTNCDSRDLTPLLKTIQHLDKHIPGLLAQSQYINLGGGYLLEENDDTTPLFQGVQLLQDKYNLRVMIEPGAGLIQDRCYLVAEVTDIFDSESEKVAILNTTVNHMPEIFEYQFSPDIAGSAGEDGRYTYILGGATCLAGDVFGVYSFDTPLAIGSRVVFTGVGVYTLVKSHMFNGINLPAIYALTAEKELQFKKGYNYRDFKNRCGGEF